MGSFDVLQRTTDSYFDANALMHQWNSIKGNSKREMKRFLTSPKTIAFIDEIDKREAQSQKSDMAIGQQHEILLAKKNKRNPIMFYQHEINKYLISHEI